MPPPGPPRAARRGHPVGGGRRRGGRRQAGAATAERGGDPQRRPGAVLVEAPAPVGAAVVDAVDAADLRPAPLGGHPPTREDRVGVVDPADHLGGVDRLGPVQRHQVALRADERLQAVHVVGHGRAPGGLVGEVEVPARPGAAAPWHQGGVGVQDGLVALVGERAEQVALEPVSARPASRAPGRRGRRGRPRRSAPRRRRERRRRRVGEAADPANRGAEADPVGERGGQRLDVAAGAAGDRSPARAVADLQDAVVVEERGEERGREASTSARGRPTRRRRPGGRSGARRSSRSSRRRRGTRAARDRCRSRPTSSRASRLKRTRSESIRMNRGSTRWPGPAKIPRAPRAAHSNRARRRRRRRSSCWPAGVATPSSASMPLEVRVVAVVEDDEAGVDVDRAAPARRP